MRDNVPEGEPVKISKRENMSGGKIFWGGECVSATKPD